MLSHKRYRVLFVCKLIRQEAANINCMPQMQVQRESKGLQMNSLASKKKGHVYWHWLLVTIRATKKLLTLIWWQYKSIVRLTCRLQKGQESHNFENVEAIVVSCNMFTLRYKQKTQKKELVQQIHQWWQEPACPRLCSRHAKLYYVRNMSNAV